MENKKITFNDLKWDLKLPVIVGWIYFILFVIGVIAGITLAIIEGL